MIKIQRIMKEQIQEIRFSLKELSLCQTLNFLIPISLKPDDVNP